MSSESLVKVALILSAHDKMTRTINEATRNAQAKIAQLKNKSQQYAMKGASYMAAGAAVVAPLTMATKKAIEFEDTMADVAKVTNVQIGSKEFENLSNQAKDLSQYLGRSVTESAGLMANLAQGGVAQKDLAAVSKIAGEVGVAFGLAGDEAGEKFIKMKNALGISIPEAKKAADAMNYLSDNTAAKASDILTYMAAGGAGISSALKISAPISQAFGASLISIGKSGEEAATIMERFQKGLLTNADAAAIFNKAGGGEKGMIAVLQHGNKLKDPFQFFQNFGAYGTSIQQMAANMGKSGGLLETLNLVSNEGNYFNSVTNEFNNRNSTAAGQLRKLKAQFEVLAINLGTAVVPIIKTFMDVIKPIADAISSFTSKHPEIAKFIAVTALAIGVFFGVMSAINMVKAAFIALKVVAMSNPWILAIAAAIAAVTFIVMNWESIVNVFKRVWDGVKLVFSYAWKFIKFLLLNFTPYGLIFQHWDKITAFFTVLWLGVKKIFSSVFSWIKDLIISTSPLGYVIKNWDKIRAFFVRLWEWLKNVFKNAWEFIKYFIMNFTNLGLIIKNWDKITAFFSGLWDRIKGIFQSFIKWIFNLGIKFYDAGKNIIKSIWDGIKSMASKPVEAIANIIKKIRDYLPFSPAKVGPFRDLHKLKIVETIAATIKPAPMVKAMQYVTASAIGAGSLGYRGGSAGPMVTVHFSPSITISGGGNGNIKEDIISALKEREKDLLRLINDAVRRNERTRY